MGNQQERKQISTERYGSRTWVLRGKKNKLIEKSKNKVNEERYKENENVMLTSDSMSGGDSVFLENKKCSISVSENQHTVVSKIFRKVKYSVKYSEVTEAILIMNITE